jgi:hypothetical protein
MLLDKHKIYMQVLLKLEWLEDGIIPTTLESIEDNVVQGQHQAYLEKPSTESFELAPLDP